jgi:hypothetical protein
MLLITSSYINFGSFENPVEMKRSTNPDIIELQDMGKFLRRIIRITIYYEYFSTVNKTKTEATFCCRWLLFYILKRLDDVVWR